MSKKFRSHCLYCQNPNVRLQFAWGSHQTYVRRRCWFSSLTHRDIGGDSALRVAVALSCPRTNAANVEEQHSAGVFVTIEIRMKFTMRHQPIHQPIATNTFPSNALELHAVSWALHCRFVLMQQQGWSKVRGMMSCSSSSFLRFLTMAYQMVNLFGLHIGDIFRAR